MGFGVENFDGEIMKDVVLNVYLYGKLSKEIDLLAEDVAKKISFLLNLALQVKIELTEVFIHSGTDYGFADVEICKKKKRGLSWTIYLVNLKTVSIKVLRL